LSPRDRLTHNSLVDSLMKNYHLECRPLLCQFEIEIAEEFSDDNLLELLSGNKADVAVSGNLSIANSTKVTRVRVETTDDE
jgi:hypothetical protein